jgi:uncharacterized protein (TIGR00251 family)
MLRAVESHMRLRIHVSPNSRRPGIEELPDGTLKVRVSAPPQEGKANQAVIEALARHFGIPRTQVRIVHGQAGRQKVVETAGATSSKSKGQIPKQGANDK